MLKGFGLSGHVLFRSKFAICVKFFKTFMTAFGAGKSKGGRICFVPFQMPKIGKQP